jgi:hypothetical protein
VRAKNHVSVRPANLHILADSLFFKLTVANDVETIRKRRSSIDLNQGQTCISSVSAIFSAPLCSRKTSKHKIIAKGDFVKTLLTITSGVGIVMLLFAGYVCFKAIPDVGRYIRINRM